MPGPNSHPNGTVRRTPQWIPPKLAARIAAWQQTVTGSPKPATEHHKPGSQKK